MPLVPEGPTLEKCLMCGRYFDCVAPRCAIAGICLDCYKYANDFLVRDADTGEVFCEVEPEDVRLLAIAGPQPLLRSTYREGFGWLADVDDLTPRTGGKTAEQYREKKLREFYASLPYDTSEPEPRKRKFFGRRRRP